MYRVQTGTVDSTHLFLKCLVEIRTDLLGWTLEATRARPFLVDVRMIQQLVHLEGEGKDRTHQYQHRKDREMMESLTE